MLAGEVLEKRCYAHQVHDVVATPVLCRCRMFRLELKPVELCEAFEAGTLFCGRVARLGHGEEHRFGKGQLVALALSVYTIGRRLTGYSCFLVVNFTNALAETRQF